MKISMVLAVYAALLLLGKGRGQQSDIDIPTLLSDGDRVINLDEEKSLIVFMGSTGTGKSTLLKFVLHDESLVVERKGRYLLFSDKGETISNKTASSKTLIPNIRRDLETGIMLADCPGFSDTRSAQSEIASTYFIKKVLESAKEIKIILVENHFSLTDGSDRTGLTNLLEYVTKLIPDIEYLRSSIGFVASKVDGNNSDEEEIKFIVEFFNETKHSLIEKLQGKFSHSQQEIDRWEKMVNLLNILLGEFSGNNIALFRRPTQVGYPWDSSVLRDNYESLRKLIFTSTPFVSNERGIFKYSVSPRSLLLIREEWIVKYKESVVNNFQCITNGFENSFLKRLEQILILNLKYDFIFKLEDMVNTFRENFKSLNYSINIYHGLLREIHTQIFNPNFKIPLFNAIKQAEFLYSVVDESLDPIILEVKNIFSAQIVQVVENYRFLYEYLKLVEKGLLQYNIQLKRDIYYRKLSTFTNEKYFGHLILGLSDLKINPNLTTFVLSATTSEQYISELRELLTENLNYKVNHKLLGSKLYIEGSNLISSEVKNILRIYTNYSDVNLFAYNYIYIDDNLLLENAHLNIIAPYIYVAKQVNITLVGRKVEDYNKAPKSNSRTKPGNAGRAGIPGTDSVNIFIVSLEVFYQDRLTISSIGGQGGKGEDGGDGYDGEESSIPDIENIEGFNDDVFSKVKSMGYDYDTFETDTPLNILVPTLIVNYVQIHDAFILAINNTQENILPTNGGDGGLGGIGGNAGNIVIFTKHFTEIKMHKERGNKGLPGKGGNGGLGKASCAFTILYCEAAIKFAFLLIIPVYFERNAYYHCKTRTNQTCCDSLCGNEEYCGKYPDGQEGSTGTSLYLQQNERTIGDINFADILKVFKSFTISNYQSKLHHDLYLFTDFFQNHERISKSYGPMEYLNDILLIEITLSFSIKNLDQLRFYYRNLYESFVSAKRLGYVKNSIESYLVELVLISKLEDIRSLEENKLIIDLTGYIGQKLSIMEQIKAESLISRIYESSEAYLNEFSKVIKKNQFFIEDELEKQIKKKMEQAEESMEMIGNEIFAARHDSIRHSKDIFELETQLRNNMQNHAIFGTLKVLKSVIDGFEPVAGAAFGTIIDIAELSVIQEIDVTKKTAVPNLPPGIEFSNKVLNDVNEHSISTIKSKTRTYNIIVMELKSLVENNFNGSDSTSALLENITEVSNSLNNFDVANNNDTFIAGVFLEKIFNQSNNIISIIEKEHITNKTGSNTVRAFGKIKKFTTLTSQASRSVVSTLQKYAKDKQKLKLVYEAIEKNGELIQKLNNFEKSLFQFIQPLFNNLTDTLKQFSNDLPGKSYFLLQIKKLDIKSHLKEILTFVSKFTQGFEGGEDLTQVVTDLEDLIYILIDAYDKINELEYKFQLAKFITNANTRDFRNTVINNANYSALFAKVNRLISSNVLIAEYNSIYQAYKQHVFPFVSKFIDYLNFDTIDIGNETFIMTKTLFVMNGIKKINKKLIDMKTQIIEGTDSIIHTAEFDSRSALNPFYTWNGREHSKTIQNFLRGDRITLLADVKTVQHLNAVKFMKLQLNITCREHSLNTNLHRQLRALQVEMKHMGESHYKCDLKYFAIRGNSFTITHSFDANQHGIPTSKNSVYDKIIAGDISLSPYTLWQFQLKPLPGYFMPDLSRYFGLIDLELVGTGQYISEGSEICATPLEMHYDTLK